MKTIGVIADTHGLLREEAIQLLQGCDLILHAGDIGKPEVLEQLRRIAPVVAIRGNVDREDWAATIAETETLEIEGKTLYLIHNLKEIEIDPVGRFDVVVSGHSHKPSNYTENGVLYFNPASAGPRRFSLPIALGKLEIRRGRIEGQIIEIPVAKKAKKSKA